MLTANRREMLDKRDTLTPREKSVYDYRILQWLKTMLDSGPDGGIGDINKVLDTLDRDAIRKHLKDENVYDLLKLIERLLEILDFLPVGRTESKTIGGMEVLGTPYVSKMILVAPKGGGKMERVGQVRSATKEELMRNKMLKDHVDIINYFIEPKTSIPDPRSAEYFKEQIAYAHEQGLVALAYDIKEDH